MMGAGPHLLDGFERGTAPSSPSDLLSYLPV
jgi:hypothetical protein